MIVSFPLHRYIDGAPSFFSGDTSSSTKGLKKEGGQHSAVALSLEFGIEECRLKSIHSVGGLAHRNSRCPYC